jgi:hypothetical protein
VNNRYPSSSKNNNSSAEDNSVKYTEDIFLKNCQTYYDDFCENYCSNDNCDDSCNYEYADSPCDFCCDINICKKYYHS